MIIVSNEKVFGHSEKTMAYSEFENQIFGDGLEVDDDLIINANEVPEDVYKEICDLDFVTFFSLTGEVPDYFDVNKVEDWSEEKEIDNSNSNSNDVYSNSDSPYDDLNDEPIFNSNTNNQISFDDKKDNNIVGKIPDPDSISDNFAHNAAVKEKSETEPPITSPTASTYNNDISTDKDSDDGINVDDSYNASENISDSMKESIANLLDESLYDYDDAGGSDDKDARIVVFGSSKGGTGKTFTSVMSTYRYAKTHPHERIALIDFDIIDGQVGISIHKIKPTMRNYLTEYQKGYGDFQTMHNFCVKANDPYPQNVDFYLAPSNGTVINNDDFWFNIIENAIKNYDVVVFDTGIDYLNIAPISYAYKIADKINLVTTTSIKSVNSITKQIGKLKGEAKNPVFSKEDELAPRLNIIITQMVSTNPMNKTICDTLSNKCNIIAKFGVITDSISRAEYYGEWDVFDRNSAINKAFDDIMS